METITLHCTTLHYTTLHYTTLHYTILMDELANVSTPRVFGRRRDLGDSSNCTFCMLVHPTTSYYPTQYNTTPHMAALALGSPYKEHLQTKLPNLCVGCYDEIFQPVMHFHGTLRVFQCVVVYCIVE